MTKNWKEILICALLIALTFALTRLWRDEEILNMQAEARKQAIGITNTKKALQFMIDSGSGINVELLNKAGWGLVKRDVDTNEEKKK